MSISVEDLWKKYLIVVENNRELVDCKLLDVVSGKEIQSKYAFVEQVISEMVAGTELVAKDLIRKVSSKNQQKHAIYIPARTMQLILLRGFKKIPWNETRRRLVEHFFPQDVLPYIEPHKARRPMSETAAPDDADSITGEGSNAATGGNKIGLQSAGTIIGRIAVPIRTTNMQRYITAWQKPEGAVKFWRQVFWFTKHRHISIQGLITFIKQNAQTHHRQSRKGWTNITKVLMHGLTPHRGSMRGFCDDLSIAMRTGNGDMLIDVIRGHLKTPGLQANLVPSIRSIKQSTASITSNFIALCKPERTHSGFRVDLVSSVKVAAFLLYRVTCLNGLRVDIWGDGCEIGGIENTRLTFRLLCPNGPSAQSSDAVFCFAVYRGKDARFPLELNIGPTIVGDQESGWMYSQVIYVMLSEKC